MAGDGRRRGAREWRRLVRAWRRSGLARAEFAATHGVAASTLSWWRWRLQRESRDAEASRTEQPGLVRVDVVDASTQQTPAHARWEITAPSGHTLRVFDADSDSLRAAVEALVRSG